MAAATMAEAPKLVVLCDHTWCGRETNTDTNVQYLAKMIGIDMTSDTGPDNIHTLGARGDSVQAFYADGVGLGSTFLDYLVNGATGNDIAKKCTEAYQYIVENYTTKHEIWMFGLSRGAFTVRCVAGMINNCGIVRPRLHADGSINRDQTAELCKGVYKIYRSPYALDAPQSPQMQAFRQHASYQVTTPVKFMGLFDTVGSLGIPHFTGGVGFEWPKFYDQNVSSVVEKVYHAVSIHDRQWILEPCLALRGPNTQDRNPQLEIHERWFPGAHYDLGRVRFHFFRAGWQGIDGVVLKFLNRLGNTIEPNQVLSDLVLKWMLESIDQHDPNHSLIRDMANQRSELRDRINAATQKGSGDVSGEPLKFLPFGRLIGFASNISGILGRGISSLLGFQSILNILLAVMDRRVPDDHADLYPYNVPDLSLGTNPIEVLATLNKTRYPSRTYESFQLYRLAGELIDQAEYDRLCGVLMKGRANWRAKSVEWLTFFTERVEEIRFGEGHVKAACHLGYAF
jgi:hypothetical protein